MVAALLGGNPSEMVLPWAEVGHLGPWGFVGEKDGARGRCGMDGVDCAQGVSGMCLEQDSISIILKEERLVLAHIQSIAGSKAGQQGRGAWGSAGAQE